MNEMEVKNLKSLSEFLPLKNTMITQILISVAIISLVFSLSSPSLLYNQNVHYFSSNSFHPMSIAMNKNYIFLIFNGILVFLAKTSALAPPPSASEPDDMLQKRIISNDEFQVEITEAETLISDKHIAPLDESPLSTEKDEDEDDEENDEDEDTKAEERDDQESEHSNENAVQVMIAIDDGRREDDENERQICCLFDGRDEEGSNGGEEVDEIEKLSNEELNKKFEDFIRRMKEEFRINQYQQKQLVLVK